MIRSHNQHRQSVNAIVQIIFTLCILIKWEWGLEESLGTLLLVRNFQEDWSNLSTRPQEKKQPMTCIFVLHWHYRQGCHLPTPAATHFTQPFICILESHCVLTYATGSSTCFLSCRYHKADRKKRLIFLFAEADALQSAQKAQGGSKRLRTI